MNETAFYLSMNTEESLRRVLGLLKFEKGLADFAQENALSFRLKYAIEWLEKAIQEVNPSIDTGIISELHNLSGETPEAEKNIRQLVDPYYDIQKRATQPLLLTLGENNANGVTVDVVTVAVPTAKEKVAEYLKKTSG